MYRRGSLQMESQVSQTSQWSKTCIREGANAWGKWVKQPRQWNKTCIGEGAYGWNPYITLCGWLGSRHQLTNKLQTENKCRSQVKGLRFVSRKKPTPVKKEWSSPVSGIRLVSGKELTDGKTSVSDKSVDWDLYQGGRFRLEKNDQQSGQWNNTCIKEGAYGWKNEWSSQVSGLRLVKGREITDRMTSVEDKGKDKDLYQGGRFRLEKKSEAAPSVK